MIAAALWITDLGSGPCLTAVAGVASLLLWMGARVWLIPPLWLVFLAAQLTTWAGKFAVGRHRPAFIVEAMQAASVYGFLAYALTREREGPRSRFEIWFWAGVLVLCVGFSRIFLSVHYTTDVAGGFIVGAFWVLVGVIVAEWRRGSHIGRHAMSGR